VPASGHISGFLDTDVTSKFINASTLIVTSLWQTRAARVFGCDCLQEEAGRALRRPLPGIMWAGPFGQYTGRGVPPTPLFVVLYGYADHQAYVLS